MKARLGDIRRMIREEFLRGVPEFALRQATRNYVDEVRQHVKRFVLMNKSQTTADQRYTIDLANQVLEELEEETFNLLEDKLWQFVRQV